MSIIVWSHWIWEIGLLFLIIGCLYVNSDNVSDNFINFWNFSPLPYIMLIVSILAITISYFCLCIGVNDSAEDYSYKNCWWNGTKMLLAVLVVAAIVGGIILFKSLKKKSFEKKLKEIDIAIKKVNEQKRKILKTHQYGQSKEYEELDRMEDVLTDAKTNIERQAAMAEVSRGIRAIKDIQRDYEFIDVQKEIDEIDALNELGW